MFDLQQIQRRAGELLRSWDRPVEHIADLAAGERRLEGHRRGMRIGEGQVGAVGGAEQEIARAVGLDAAPLLFASAATVAVAV